MVLLKIFSASQEELICSQGKLYFNTIAIL